MSGIKAIVKKEWRSYFYSPVGFVVLGVFLFIMGLIFAKFVAISLAYNAAQRQGGAQGVTLDKIANYLYQNMAFFICFFTPFVTMRLYAEERRQQTMELLLTAPLRGFELVLGKFLAAFSLSLVMVAITMVYVVFMVMWGNPDVNIILSTYLGLFLALATYISIGGLVSALSNSQVIAAILTFVLLILLWLLQSFAQGLSVKTGFIEWGPLLSYLSPLSHFSTFGEGLIQLKDIVYFVSFIGLMLFLTHRVVESNRWR